MVVSRWTSGGAVGRWCCLAGGGLGALGLLASMAGFGALTAIVPGQSPMMPNTGLSLFLLGGSAALRARDNVRWQVKVASILAAIAVLAIGLGTLLEYAFSVDLRIDRALVPSVGLGPHPGRPSPVTAIALVLFASGLLVFDTRPQARFRPSEGLVLLGSVVAFTALIGFAFGAGPLYRLMSTPVVGVALPTAIALLLLAAGMLLERPHAGLMKVATAAGPGGVLLRRLVLPALAAPPILAITVTRAFGAIGIEEPALAVPVLAALTSLVALLLLGVAAAPLNRAHAALEESRARTRDLVDLAPDGIFVADLEGRYSDVNGAGCRMLGYSRDEIVGKTIVDLIHPREVGRLWESKDILLRGAVHVGEWHLRRKDGSYLPVEVSATIFADGRWQGFVRDISERERAREELRQARERIELALEGADLGAWDWHIDTGQVVFNARWAEMRGFRPEEARGHVDWWWEGVHPEDLPAVKKRLDDYLLGNTPSYEAELRVRTKSGEWIWVLDKGKVFARTGQGEPTRMVGTELDITARKDAESALCRAEAEQRFLAEVGSALAMSLDYEETLTKVAELAAQGPADLCIVDVVGDNDRLRRIAVGNHDSGAAWISEALKRCPSERPDALFQGAFERQSSVLIEEVTPEILSAWAAHDEDLSRALRSVSPGSMLAVPLVGRERVLGMVTLISTGAHRYREPELRLAEELARSVALSVDNARLYRAARRAIRERDDVLGIVAHDLRNPLGAILMQAARLRRPGAEGASGRAADAIERAARRMKHLIQDLLDVTRLDAGGLSLAPSRTAVSPLVAEAIDAQQSQVVSVGCALEGALAPDLGDIWADRNRVLQIFENLIGNALKFTEPGGRVIVGAAPREAEVLFWVADTGRGIPEEDLPHLFDRFWQARKGDREGAGLGLPIVKGLVEAHRGRLWVESTPGRGSTFFFTLPAAPRSADQPAGSGAPVTGS